MTKILISAGEASGDLHAGAVTCAIRQLDPAAEIFGMGGHCFREAGGEVLFDIKDHSVMGFRISGSCAASSFPLWKDGSRTCC